MQRKDLALRVLSTAAIMSIVTSIAAPAFADIYYIGNGSIDVVTKTGTDGEYVEVTQNGKTYTDTSKEIVIKDGTSEKDATLKEAARAEGTQAKPAVAPAAGAVTQELEAAGSADAAGESQPDPDAGFTLNETGEDSAQTQESKDTTENPTEDTPDPSTEDTKDNPTEPPKKDVEYQYDPAADPNPEQQATKPTLSTSAAPTAETREATQANAPAADPAPTTPAEGSAENPTKNVIRVINNWVGDAAKELKIRLSNVNIKVDNTSRYASGGRDFYFDEWNYYYGVSAAQVKGTGNTKIELDGQNVLDSDVRSSPTTSVFWAGLNKKGNGNLTITDETSDTGETITAKDETDTSGSLRAEGGEVGRAAAIGGNSGQATDNITIEGYATVKANTLGHNGAGIGGGNGAKGSNITIQGHANVTANGGWSGAGIGGGSQGNDGGGDAENIIIQDYAKVTATAYDGAAIGSGSAQYSVWGDQEKSGVAKNIVIRGHAIVNAKNDGSGAAIGAAGNGKDASAEVTIGTPGATAETEDVHVTAIGHYGSAIGNGAKDTKVTIQGHVTIQTASDDSNSVIGSSRGNVEVNIKDNASIDPAPSAGISSDIAGGCDIGGGNLPGREVVVNIDGGKHGKVKIGENHAILGSIYGAISGTKVNIGDNVLLKMLQSGWSTDAKYINVNGAEAEVGTRDNPGAGGLVIGDNTELWYINNGDELQKIVHGKNLCKKSPKQNITKEPTCTESGSADCTCDYEHTNGAAHPSCNRTWTDKVPALGHHWTDNGDNSTHICVKGDATEAHSYGEWTTVTPATCTTAGQKQRTCTECGHVETQEIPATGHHWVDKGDGTHTCPDCGATEGQPFNTNSALELRVVDAEGMNQPFTVSQNGTLRTYTGAYDTATLTGDLDTLRYLQEHGAQTIQFVTNGQTSSFAINDLLAQGSGSEVFYLTHRGAEEPTLLLVEADHSDLVKD